tara:strand:+ start:363 stop:791 length:429 start_codon:yes stop_codon:yes gene_type:complete
MDRGEGLMSEKTLCIIKPDAVENNFVDEINMMIKSQGLSILKSVNINISSEIAERFYAEHAQKPFFKELVNFITSGPSVVQILEGDSCIEKYRNLMGTTNPEEAKEGTIRKRFAESISKNAVHGSDSLESALREIEIMSPLF